jgi:hypothetical protein
MIVRRWAAVRGDAVSTLPSARPSLHPFPLPAMLTRRLALSRSLLTVALVPLAARAQPAPTPAPAPRPMLAPSSFASVEVHVNSRPVGRQWFAQDASYSGPARIAIVYGQPHARGRAVEGGLIPKDKVWRLGANMATTLHTDVDLTLGALHVPRGDYTLYLLNGSDGWQLIVNRQTAQWGTEYDATRDLGRTALTRRALTEPMDSFTVYLIPAWIPGRADGGSSLHGTLSIMWGSSALSTDWQVEGAGIGAP